MVYWQGVQEQKRGPGPMARGLSLLAPPTGHHRGMGEAMDELRGRLAVLVGHVADIMVRL